eukprot:CAMPEP_0168470862 /NCGR_PEP_ID=MMETSP0228-20121227/58968_1 /TAXON_ID=133427 /ORGANISM="Protoceratium reticulatum, Strain CCCM 535 (=CCMP 1889)" /LENGTH=132 /DNA_ID=CAMNT_0008486719 /DNA_START=30 /DNA_END=428 /DNA_ORIENTATION=+
MALSLVPYVGLLCFAAQYLYPAYETIRVMMQDKPTAVALTQWTVFWVICVAFATVESNFLFLLADYLPLYHELKVLAFLWLVHPQYLGAAWLWYGKVQQVHGKYDQELYHKAMAAMGAGKAEAPKAEATKEE